MIFHPPILDIFILQGADADIPITIADKTSEDDSDDSYTPRDITDYKFKAAIKESAEDDIVIAEFDVEMTDPANGLVDLVMPADVTDSINTDGDYWKEMNTYYWDCYMFTPEGETFRILQGKAKVSPGISR